jgi:hypothetical protein
MNEQQLAAVRLALESMTDADRLLEDEGYGRAYQQEAITALQSIIAQDALYKMAEDAVTIGLSYNDWPKIGCVNHDCDQCKAAAPVQSCYCENCEALAKELAALKAQPAPDKEKNHDH